MPQARPPTSSPNALPHVADQIPGLRDLRLLSLCSFLVAAACLLRVTKEGCPGLSLPKLGKHHAGQNEFATLQTCGVLIHHSRQKGCDRELESWSPEGRACDQPKDELRSLWCFTLHWSQSEAGEGNHSHWAAQLLFMRITWRWKPVLVNQVMAICMFGDLAYYRFLEKDLDREGGQRTPRSIFLWLRRKPYPNHQQSLTDLWAPRDHVT